jgi:hypothetical protein
METGADHGMWTWTRYRNWMANRRDWYVPPKELREQAGDEVPPTKLSIARTQARSVSTDTIGSPAATPAPKASGPTTASAGTRIEIEPDEGSFGKILKR